MPSNAAVILFLFLTAGASAVRAEPHDGAGDDHHGHEKHEPGVVELDEATAAAEGVHVVRSAPGSIRPIVSLYGEVSLNGGSIVHVSPRFPGVLKQVTKELGDTVKAGDLLAVLQSNESLTTYQVRAEVDGTVLEKDATRGEFVRDDKVLFVIANLDSVWVNAAVYPADLDRVAVGREAFVIARSSDLRERGTISYVRPALSDVTKTALARIVLQNTGRRWLPGMFVRVEVLLDAEPAALVVPRSAVVFIENVQSVFVKTGAGEFRLRAVTAGRSDAEWTEILTGLTGGTEIAAGNTYLLKAELGKGSASHEH